MAGQTKDWIPSLNTDELPPSILLKDERMKVHITSIFCLVIFGILVGAILSYDGSPPKSEFEPFVWYEQLKFIIFFAVIMGLPYLAGREDMKGKL